MVLDCHNEKLALQSVVLYFKKDVKRIKDILTKESRDYMIFKEIKWNNISDESQLYKKQVNGLNDPCLKDYNPLLFSTCFKEEYKKDKMKEEYIKSFIEAAKALSKATKKKQLNVPGINKIVYSYSLTLPALYLCRHSIEMVIKYSLESLNIEYRKIHKLIDLWNRLVEVLPSNLQSGKERTIINNMGIFIDKMNNLDENGQRLRYAIQTSGDLSQENFLWVNIQNVVDSTEKFINQILSINVDDILKNKSQ